MNVKWKLMRILFLIIGMNFIFTLTACDKNMQQPVNENVNNEYSEEAASTLDSEREIEERTTAEDEEQETAKFNEDKLWEEHKEFIFNLAELLETEDFEQAFEELESDEFQELKSMITRSGNQLVYEKDGKGIGFYRTNGLYMVYYGDYVNRMRHGYGIWLCSCFEEANWFLMQYRTAGQWSDDFPNGNQEEVLETKVIDSSNVCTRIGTVIDGLWDGQIQESYKGNDHIYIGSLTKGYWNVIEQMEEGSYVVLEARIIEDQNTSLRRSRIGVHEDGLQTQEGILGFVEQKMQ